MRPWSMDECVQNMRKQIFLWTQSSEKQLQRLQSLFLCNRWLPIAESCICRQCCFEVSHEKQTLRQPQGPHEKKGTWFARRSYKSRRAIWISEAFTISQLWLVIRNSARFHWFCHSKVLGRHPPRMRRRTAFSLWCQLRRTARFWQLRLHCIGFARKGCCSPL